MEKKEKAVDVAAAVDALPEVGTSRGKKEVVCIRATKQDDPNRARDSEFDRSTLEQRSSFLVLLFCAAFPPRCLHGGFFSGGLFGCLRGDGQSLC